MTSYDESAIANPENVDALTHQQIYDAFHTVDDRTADVVTAWRQAGDRWRESTTEMVQAVQAAVDGRWTGTSADAAARALTEYGTHAGELSDLFHHVGQVVADTALAAMTAKAYVPPPVPVTTDQTTNPTGHDAQTRAAHQAQDDARHIMQQRYLIPLLDQATRLPIFPAAVTPLAESTPFAGTYGVLSTTAGEFGDESSTSTVGAALHGDHSPFGAGTATRAPFGGPPGTGDTEATSSVFDASTTRARRDRPSGRTADIESPRSSRTAAGVAEGAGLPRRRSDGPVADRPETTGDARHHPGRSGTASPGTQPSERATPAEANPSRGDPRAPTRDSNAASAGVPTAPATTPVDTATAGPASGSGPVHRPQSPADIPGAGSATPGSSAAPGSVNSPVPPSNSAPPPSASAPGSASAPSPAPPPTAPPPSALAPGPTPVPPTAPSPTAPVPPSAGSPPAGPVPAVPPPATTGPSTPAPSNPALPNPTPSNPVPPGHVAAPQPPTAGTPGAKPPPAPLNPPAPPTPKVPTAPVPPVAAPPPDLTPVTTAGGAAVTGTAAAVSDTPDTPAGRLPRMPDGYSGGRDRPGLRFDRHRADTDAPDATPAGIDEGIPAAASGFSEHADRDAPPPTGTAPIPPADDSRSAAAIPAPPEGHNDPAHPGDPAAHGASASPLGCNRPAGPTQPGHTHPPPGRATSRSEGADTAPGGGAPDDRSSDGGTSDDNRVETPSRDTESGPEHHPERHRNVPPVIGE